MELPLPGQVHGWWQKTVKNEQDHRQRGRPDRRVGVDAFRYYVVRELDIGPDGNWTDESQARYSAELANGLGNFVNRSLSMLNRYRGGTLEATSEELVADAEKWIAEAKGNYESHQICCAGERLGTGRSRQPVRRADRAIQAGQAGGSGRPAQRGAVQLAECCRILAVLIWPVTPETAEKIFEQVGIDALPQILRRLNGAAWARPHPQQTYPALPRKDLEKK